MVTPIPKEVLDSKVDQGADLRETQVKKALADIGVLIGMSDALQQGAAPAAASGKK